MQATRRSTDPDRRPDPPGVIPIAGPVCAEASGYTSRASTCNAGRSANSRNSVRGSGSRTRPTSPPSRSSPLHHSPHWVLAAIRSTPGGSDSRTGTNGSSGGMRGTVAARNPVASRTYNATSRRSGSPKLTLHELPPNRTDPCWHLFRGSGCLFYFGFLKGLHRGS